MSGWSEEAIVKALQRAAEELGHPPTQRDLREMPATPSDESVRRVFGSYNKGLLAAGLDVHTIDDADIPVPDEFDIIRSAAYRMGYRASLQGEPKETVPYESNRGGHREAWVRGWEDAEDESREVRVHA